MRYRSTVSIVALVWLAAASTASAGQVCTDMDGDGTAETCIETRDTDDDGQDDTANIPGEDPPEVPDPGPGKPVDEEPEDNDSGDDDSDDDSGNDDDE